MIATLEQEGLDPLLALRSANIDPDFKTLHRRITQEQEHALQKEFVRLTGYRPDLWVRMGRNYSLATFGQFALIMMTAPTLRTLLALPNLESFGFHGLRFFPIMVNNRLMGLQLDASEVEPFLREFSILVSVGCILRLYPELCTNDFRFSLICLPFADYDGKLSAEIKGVPLSFNGSQAMVLWPFEQSEMPLRNANAVLFKSYVSAFRSMLRNPHIKGDIKLRVSEGIGRNLHQPALLEAVAASVSMSVRTLQRRLSEAGLKFRDLVDERRREAAIKALTLEDLPLTEVGWSLGYADLSSFTHAFQRWTGSTPSNFRRQVRSQQAPASKPLVLERALKTRPIYPRQRISSAGDHISRTAAARRDPLRQRSLV